MPSKTPPQNAKPYPVTNLPEAYFTFTTNNDLTYYGRFGNMDEFMPPLLRIYNFDISVFEFDYLDRDPNLKGSAIKDARIAATIIQVIVNRLSNPYKAILFICDEDTDRRRGRYRQLLFSTWHKAMGSLIGLRKLNPIIETASESQTLYAGILYRNDCTDKDFLVQAIIDATPQIIMDKFWGRESE